MTGPELILMAAVAVFCGAVGWYGRGILKNLQYTTLETMCDALEERKESLAKGIESLCANCEGGEQMYIATRSFDSGEWGLTSPANLVRNPHLQTDVYDGPLVMVELFTAPTYEAAKERHEVLMADRRGVPDADEYEKMRSMLEEVIEAADSGDMAPDILNVLRDVGERARKLWDREGESDG